MGWKIFLIAITNAANVNVADVPAKLGMEHLKPAKELSLHNAQYEEGVSIGQYKDQLFIVSSEWALDCFDEVPSKLEQKIGASFPKSEIAVIVINETTNLFGYNVIKDGKRYRVYSGADTEIFVDKGTAIPEEEQAGKDNLIEDESLAEMKDEFSEKEFLNFIKNQHGIKAAYLLTQRYFVKQFDNKASDYYKVKVTKFE